MMKTTSSRVLVKVFAMGLVRVSALLHTSAKTAVFSIVNTIAASMDIVASSILKLGACARTGTKENIASIESVHTTAPTPTASAIKTLGSVCAILYILLLIEGYHGVFGRVRTAPICQCSVEKQPTLTLFGYH